MKNIRVVINKNGSATAYIPAGLTDLFSQITQAGHMDLTKANQKSSTTFRTRCLNGSINEGLGASAPILYRRACYIRGEAAGRRTRYIKREAAGRRTR